MTKNMTEGTPWKHTLMFSLPVLAGSFLQQLYNTVDAIVVGKYAGEDSLSAVGTTGSFAFFFLAVAIGLSSGNGVVVAQHYGAEEHTEVRRNAATGIFFLMVLGVIAALMGIAAARPAFTYLLNVPDEILDMTLLYFRIFAAGMVFQYGYNSFSAILRAVGDSMATLYFLLISSALNIGLDLLFVKNFGWGVAGAAIATVISQAASFAAAYIYMRVRYPIFRFKFSDYKWDGELIGKTVKVGFPISLQLIIVSFGLTFIQRAVNEFGKTMTASFTVGQRIEMYLNLGLSSKAAEYCLAHLRTVALINVVLSMYIPLFGVFQGTGHSGLPMLVACGALGIRVLVTYLFRYSTFFGYTIVWWNGIFGFGLGFLITWTFYLSGRWSRKINRL